MIKFHQGFSATGIYEEGYNVKLVNMLLIASCAGVFFAGLYSSVGSIVDTLSESRAKDKPDKASRTKSIPTGDDFCERHSTTCNDATSRETKPNVSREKLLNTVQERLHPIHDRGNKEEQYAEQTKEQQQPPRELPALKRIVV